MESFKRAGVAGLTAALCFIAGLATPYSTVQAQSSPQPQTEQVAPVAETPAAAPQSMASQRLEAAARHLDRLTRELRGRDEGVQEGSALSQAAKLQPHLAGLRSLELVLNQTAVEDRADMERMRTPSEQRNRFEADESAIHQGAAEFRRVAERVEQAIAANSESLADAALDDLAAHLARTDVTRRGPFDPASLRAQHVKRETRKPAANRSELQAYLTKESSIAPLVDEGLAARAAAVVADAIPELAESEETRITPEIQALADDLGHNPVRIFNWVHNNIDFMPTHGAIQGAGLTLRNRQGNAADTNSLLAALLRASGVPARFVYGTVDVPLARAVNWLRARDVDDALGLVQTGGIPSTLMLLNGQPQALRLQHLWVEAFIDFTPSRGAINRQPDAWIPMDASFKSYSRTQPLDLLGLGQWSAEEATAALKQGAQFNADGSFTGLNTTAYQAYRNTVADRVAQSTDISALNDPDVGFGKYSIVQNHLPVISGTLPFAVSAASTRFAAVPNSLKFYLDVQSFASQRDIAYENPMLSMRIATVALGGQSLYIEPKPATAADEYALKAYETSNAASLPLASFNVNPRVRLGDQVLAEAGAMRMGTPQFWVAGIVDLQGHISGTWEPYEFAAGSHFTLTPDLAGMSADLADSLLKELPATAAQSTDRALHLAGVQYWLLNDSRAHLYARGNGGHFLRMPSVGVFAAPLQVRYFFGIPRTGSFAGFATDIKADRVGIVHDNPATYRQLAAQIGANGSLSEGLTWDLLLSGHPGRSLSASAILGWANRAKVPIHAITAENIDTILPKIQTTADVKAEIRNAVAAGMHVIIPEREFAQGRVQAAGYVMFDPETGGGIYRVDGGLNGAINWGCIAKAVVLNVLCETKFIRLLMTRLAALGARLAAMAGLQTLLSAACPPLGVAFAIIDAVLIAVTIFQVAYEITMWVRQVMEGLIDLTPEEMAELGIKAINDYACNYLPGCLGSIPGMNAANSWFNSEVLGYDASGGAPNGPTAGNPVSIGNGVKTQIEPDYEGSGPFPLVYVRTYNSHLPNGSPVGHKWSANYQQRLILPDGTTAMTPPEAVMVQRPDGGWQQFNYRSGQYIGSADVPARFERINDGLNRTTGWRLYTVDDSVETYDADGRLLVIENRAGLRHTLSYASDGTLERVSDDFGRSLGFEYDPATHQLTTLIDPENRRTTYSYDAGALTVVTYPDQTRRQYHYETPGWPTLLTGITDERGIRYATWKYDDENRVVESTHADGADRTTFSYSELQTRVTDPYGTTRTYAFTRVFDTLRMTEVSEPCSSCGSSNAAKISYDGSGYPALLTDNNNNQTQLRVNARGLPEQWTRALGKPEAQTVSVQWHPTWRVPAVITETGATGTAKVTRVDYDERGNPRQRTVTVDGKTRTWTYEFNAAGQMKLEDGPRTDVQDILRYEYDAATGNRTLARDANGLTLRYTEHDQHGRVLQMVDDNGLSTDYRYDERGRLVESKATLPGNGGVETTTFKYAAHGALERLTLPDGSWLEYGYDDAQRLIGIRDATGNRIAYTLNAAGDRVQEDGFDPANVLAKTQHRVYDALGRLERAYGSNAAEATSYTYDDNGNERTALDPLRQRPTESQYDGLNRLMTTIDPLQGRVEYRYDAQNNLRKVIDPRQLTTSYDYNGFNELETQTSPDTGVTRFTYDAAGNLASRLDARGVNATYGYDAGNRLTSIAYPDETIAYTYDEATGGIGAKGRLTTLADGSGRTRYVYDAQGRLLQKAQQLGDDGNAAGRKALSHSYANGNIDETVLPSGARLRYRYGADGRVLEISVNGVTLLQEIEYFQTGELRSWTTAAGRYERAFDTDGRVAAHTRGVNTAHLRYDAASRIAEISENAAGRPSWQYGYDDLDRLKQAQNASSNGPLSGLALDWLLDATGNRSQQVKTTGSGTVTTDYGIDPASNRFAVVDGVARQYDPAGNTTLANGQTLVYSGRGRLVEVKLGAAIQARYAYNAVGERVCIALGGASCPAVGSAGNAHQQFVYDDAGHLVGEYDSAGALVAEHVWLGDTPVAVLKPTATAAQFGGSLAGNVAAYFVQPDHLDTPRTIVNAANQELWRWDSAPFGDSAADADPSGRGAFAYRLRFPGQQFDVVTSTNYNYFRDYEPGVGRYAESDPVGLIAGPNTFAYVASNPLGFSDPQGLLTLNLKIRPWWTPAEKRAGRRKAQALDCGCKAGRLKKTPPSRGSKSAADMFRASGGTIPPGSDIDHVEDLQLGGCDCTSNMKPLPSRVNRSFGAQIAAQLRKVPDGTPIDGICVITGAKAGK
jgi:RHS repeat-associated protein